MMKKNDEMHVFIKAMLSRSRKLVILLILIIAGSVITSLIPPLVLEKAVNRLPVYRSGRCTGIPAECLHHHLRPENDSQHPFCLM